MVRQDFRWGTDLKLEIRENLSYIIVTQLTRSHVSILYALHFE